MFILILVVYNFDQVIETIKCLHEISNNSPNDLLGTNIYKTLESC